MSLKPSRQDRPSPSSEASTSDGNAKIVCLKRGLSGHQDTQRGVGFGAVHARQARSHAHTDSRSNLAIVPSQCRFLAANPKRCGWRSSHASLNRGLSPLFRHVTPPLRSSVDVPLEKPGHHSKSGNAHQFVKASDLLNDLSAVSVSHTTRSEETNTVALQVWVTKQRASRRGQA